jgi:protein-L-isoaspartate(D-aspartate) O-methyltransferase
MDDIRNNFIDELRILSGFEVNEDNARVLEAFRNVPREAFAGPGPWKLRSPLHAQAVSMTPDDNPKYLYHCALVVLDDKKGINIGEPTMWARLFARTGIPVGSSILQVGAGTGYYTAILAELSQTGKVLAFETEDELAFRASKALIDNPQIEVRQGNGALDLTDDDGPFDLVVAFAGVTHPVDAWLKRLKPQGRLLLPITGTRGWGAMVLAEQGTKIMNAKTLGPCGFYPCAGARDEERARCIDTMWADRTRTDGWGMQIALGERIQFQVDGKTF